MGGHRRRRFKRALLVPLVIVLIGFGTGHADSSSYKRMFRVWVCDGLESQRFVKPGGTGVSLSLKVSDAFIFSPDCNIVE